MAGKLTIGLLWHTLRHPNLGVDALTRANIALIRAAAKRAGVVPEFILLGTPGSSAPDEPDVIQGGAPGRKQLLLRRGPFIQDLERCQLVFDTSEGDSFTDIYGVARCLSQVGSKLAAMRSGRHLVLAPQTIGPFETTWSRALARHVLKRAKLTFTRDHLSTLALAELGITDAVHEVIDVAFALPYTPSPRLGGTKLGVGINVSGLMYSAAHQFNMAIDYRGFVRELLARMLARPDLDVWLVPHVLASGSNDDDLAINQQLQAEFPKARLAPPFKDSSEAKSFISGLDFFTGARMHACIAAFSSGVPTVPIAYSRKFNGLFESLGYSRYVDGRASTNEAALELTAKTLERRAEAALDVRRGLEFADARLARYEDALIPLLKGTS